MYENIKSNRRIYIELNNICNIKCNFCPYPFLTNSKVEMDVELVKEILDDIKKNVSHRIIYFHNLNEPFLYKRLKDVLDYCDTIGINYGITTNGILLPQNINLLINRNINQLNISYQVTNEEQNKLRGINISVEDYRISIINSIKQLLKNNFKAAIKIKLLITEKNSTFNKKRIIGIESINEFISEIAQIYFLLHEKEFSDAQKEKIGEIDISRHCKIEIHDNIFVETFPFLNWGNYFEQVYPAIFGRCDGISEQLLIRANGDVSPCCYDFSSEILLGNIKKCKLSEVLLDRQTLKLEKSLKSNFVLKSRCRKCLGENSLKELIRKQYNTISSNSIPEQFKMSNNNVKIY